MDTPDVIIVGAGPAGIATAIQLKRYGIKYLLFEQKEIGGLLKNANSVENYPGFANGIRGSNLIKRFEKQLTNIGVGVNFEKVIELEYENGTFLAKTNRKIFKSAIAVIATGTKPKTLPYSPLPDNVDNRIFYEIYPIRKTKNKTIAIIGAGDAAFDYAFGLSRKNKVVILNRSKQIKCLPLLWSRCMKSENVSYSDNTDLKKIDYHNKQLELTYVDKTGQNEKQIRVDYVVVAVGRVPQLDFLGKRLKKNLENLIKSNKLFMIGDVKNKIYRQTAISVGDGVKAAMKIHRKLKKGNG